MDNCNEFLTSSNTVIGIGTTTCPSYESAKKLVEILMTKKIIACCQIDGPINSTYIWKGIVQNSTEWRITLKFNVKNCTKIEKIVTEKHPYDNPQWITYKANGGKKFIEWVNDPNE